MIKNILLPYFINRVDLVILLSVKSTYPVDPNSTFCSIIPIGLTIAVIPLFADLIIYFPLSIDLKVLCEKCCLGPMDLPNHPSSEILII